MTLWRLNDENERSFLVHCGDEHVQIRNARIKVLDKPQDAAAKTADKKPDSK